MCILEGAPCLVPTASKATPPGQLSAMQISKGCKRHEDTFLATIHEVGDGKNAMAMEPIPEVVGQVLKAYKDVMPPELPKRLPPRREVDRKIELEYKPGKANLVADALSRKAELAAMSRIQGELLALIKEGTKHDPLAKQLVSLMQQGKSKRF